MLTMEIPVAFSGSPGDSFRLPPPRLGEHTRSVLGDLGFAASEIDEIAPQSSPRPAGVTRAAEE